jgi:hypothetical protein
MGIVFLYILDLSLGITELLYYKMNKYGQDFISCAAQIPLTI